MFAKTLLAAAACAVFFAASAQSAADRSHGPQAAAKAPAGAGAYEFTAGDFRLKFLCAENDSLKDWMLNVVAPTMCEWTPKLAKMFRSDGWAAPKQATFRFSLDAAEDGVPAWASGSTVTLCHKWCRENIDGESLGAVIHELVHVMQAYWWNGGGTRPRATEKNCPEWASEGLADYVRWFLFEPQSGGCDSLVAEPPEKFHYNDSYRTTASFFDFVERSHPGTLKKLNAALRAHTFDDGKFWKEATGKTPLELEAGWKAELSGKRAK